MADLLVWVVICWGVMGVIGLIALFYLTWNAEPFPYDDEDDW